MKIGILVILGLAMMSGLRAFPGVQRADDDAHQQWLEARYKEAISIQPGMTRTDLMKLFFEEGGFQGGRLHTNAGRYVLKNCYFIHVDVTFDRPSGGPAGNLPDGDVKIVVVSKPYLARLVLD